MKQLIIVLAGLGILPALAFAHHGVASLGVAGLEGPGAPIETSSSATLPKGSFLFYAKLDYAKFKLFTPEVDEETELHAFWMYGLGYGATSYLSLYLFTPFYTKKLEDNSYNTSGFADLSLMGVLGFKFDEKFMLVPERESLDDLDDWHFTLYGGLSLPTGDENIADANGIIDPGMSLGFGKPSCSAGFTSTKPLLNRLTFVFDTSFITFTENNYDDGSKMRFGNEFRLNTAATFRVLTSTGAKFRLDGNFEVNYLNIGRDELNGIGEKASGGSMIYLLPGLRVFYKSSSLGFGIKLPAWTDLNEESDQQGSEGKENYRAVVSFSALL